MAKVVVHSRLLKTESPVPSQRPLDAAAVALEADDVLADAFVEKRLPGHELEAEPVLDHGKAATHQRSDASQPAADIFACLAWRVDALSPSADAPISRRWQSGSSIDVQGRISKAGNGDVRRALHEAASALLTGFNRKDKVKTWGLAIRKRSSHRKATVGSP